AQLCQPGDRLLTHCNTGSLATAGVGTALGVISAAHQRYSDIFVWVDETRPLLQGGRLTAWECGNRNIPHKIICDNMAAMLMAQGQVDRIFVGSDRIAANGDFANKIGTYSLAVLAHYHRVPFYVVAPQTTVDPNCADGQAIPIEQRSAAEVKGVSGAFGNCTWAPQDSAVFNPAFDVTPAELVSGWVLDTGVFSATDLQRSKWWLGN
ncbi:MAG: S-methyl-5-thioribose-1-phosphate isomerase, partial [Gammaproteobacteria bacterium]|nr:S-methyl-5-thioribose-1-phosphate isomerase [Gammaproteobacteria bacterium]